MDTATPSPAHTAGTWIVDPYGAHDTGNRLVKVFNGPVLGPKKSAKILLAVLVDTGYVSGMDTNGAEIRFENCGDVFHNLRDAAGLTLRALAENSGISYSKLAKIEKNEQAITLTMIEQIAEGLELPIEQIVLKCLQSRFPKLRNTEAGTIVAAYLSPSGKERL